MPFGGVEYEQKGKGVFGPNGSKTFFLLSSGSFLKGNGVFFPLARGSHRCLSPFSGQYKQEGDVWNEDRIRPVRQPRV